MISIPSILKAFWLVALLNGNPVTLNMQTTQEFPMRTAWNANGQVIRFVPFAASDASVAKLLDYAAQHTDEYVPVDWAPALTCAFDRDVLNDVYFINCGQSIIFSTEPVDENYTYTDGAPAPENVDYTPLWRVHYLEFAKGVTPRPINTVAEVQDAIDAGDLVQIKPDSVLDATIVQNSSGYVIRQASDFDIADRSIELPVVETFAREQFNPRPLIRYIALTDTDNWELAKQVGANYSPRLSDLNHGCTDDLYAFVEPTTPGQLPIINQLQQYRETDGLQINKKYNPFKSWFLFSLPQPLPADWSLMTLKSQQTTNYYLTKGVITGIGLCHPIVTNSPSFEIFECPYDN